MMNRALHWCSLLAAAVMCTGCAVYPVGEPVYPGPMAYGYPGPMPYGVAPGGVAVAPGPVYLAPAPVYVGPRFYAVPPPVVFYGRGGGYHHRHRRR
jgi:hypothetical protein